MLCCHAYNASTARDARDACLRRPDCLEVGGRQGRDALFGSSRARRDSNGTECRFLGARRCDLVFLDIFDAADFSAERSGTPLSQLRDLEAGRGRQHHQYRWCSRCEHSNRSGTSARSHGTSVLRWAVGGKRDRIDHGLLSNRDCSRAAHSDCRHQRSKWQAPARNRTCPILGAASVHRQPAGRPGLAPTAETSPAHRCSEQASNQSTFLRRSQWRERSYRSFDEPSDQADQTRTQEALKIGPDPVSVVPLSALRKTRRAATRSAGCT